MIARLRYRLFLVIAVTAAAAVAAPLPPPASPAVTSPPVDQFAGLTWRFARVKYQYHTDGSRMQVDYYGEPWGIDAPAAEQNLSRRIKTVTSIRVEDPLLIALDDPRLWDLPWIYFVEPGNLKLTDADVANLREFLLRGGTANFDDFHGPYEWENLVHELKRVFPEREITEVLPTHPVFNCFYKIDKYPQIPGLGSFLAGRTWEKGGFVPHLRTIVDDHGRNMVFINWNTDMGDGWEWSNAEEYPGYLRWTAEAYRMEINEIVYALTH